MPSALHARRQWEHGRAAFDRGQWQAAESLFREAVRHQPRDALYRLNLARVLWRQKRLEEAMVQVRALLEHAPADAVAWSLGAECLRELRRPDELVEWLRRAPPGHPLDAEHHFRIGRALEDAGRLREAIEAYFTALQTKIDHAPAHAHLGYCFDKLEMKEEAAQCFRTALTLGCGDHDVHLLGTLTFREREVCRWSDAGPDADALREALTTMPDSAERMVIAFTNLALWDEPAIHLKAAQSVARHVAKGVQPLPARRIAATHAERRLRVGYVSNDFFHHATTILMAGMLECHDRQRFEVFLYSHSPNDESALGQRVRQAAEHFVDISGIDDASAAARIHADGIDILVDLKGHTRGARPAVFAYRAAPVQVSFLGYPGTTGAPWIDYVVGDPIVTPIDDAAHFTEKIAQLPLCYQPNDSQRPVPQPMSRAEAGLPDDAVVLCAFNQPYKISPEVFDVWTQALHEVPNAVLWLLEWNPQVRKNVTAHLRLRGLSEDRIVWAPALRDYARHLSRFACADLFVDTWPYNAHTTASDALWAGVPVVTRSGRSFASRVAASLNAAVGLQALSHSTAEEYLRCIVALAGDPQARTALRAHLIDSRRSRLFDSAAFARDIEALYGRMAELNAKGEPATHLAAE
jgi:predicted O-linked N-acetylglucosamine transferase (SPINDLY family)